MGRRKKKKKRRLRRKRKILEKNEDGGPGRGRGGLQLKPAIFMFAVTWTIGGVVESQTGQQKTRPYLLRRRKKRANFLCLWSTPYLIYESKTSHFLCFNVFRKLLITWI